MIDFLSNNWSLALPVGVVLFLLFINAVSEHNSRKIAYERQRNEDISRIGEGVAYGISSVFSNDDFLKALRENARIEIKINVDGSQNIIITGNNNDVFRG